MVIQTNDFNESSIRTVMVVAITSNLGLADAPGNVRCRRGEGGLSRASVVNVSQVATIDKRALVSRIGALTPGRIGRVEAGLNLVMGL